MSVAYEHRPFSVESPYAPVGEHSGVPSDHNDAHDHHHHHHDDDDDHEMNKYINTEANVEDMEELAAAAYDGAPSPFKMPESPAAGADDALDLGPSPNVVDPANVPLRAPSSPPLMGGGGGGGGRRAVGPGSRKHSPGYSPSPRSKPIEKPSRTVTKNDAGMFECRWPDCKEDFRMFARKCEWSKHMDKHERPYICTVKGCEKIQGFTYSGGLLRHEREVHGKHGGPKKAFNCPHANCKRHNGKGFSRMENLQEHLRRVHTPNSQQSPAASEVATAALAVFPGLGGGSPAGAEDDGDGGEDGGGGAAGRAFGTEVGDAAAAVLGFKRKRSVDDEEAGRREDSMRTALLEENVLLRGENEELKRLNLELRAQLESYQAQVDAVQAAINGLAVPPPAVL